MVAPPVVTEESYPFASSEISTEQQFYDLSHAYVGDGIDRRVYSDAGFVSLDSGARTVTVNPFYAHVGGAVARQSTSLTLDVPAASGSARQDRVVVRRDPVNDQCVVDILEGTPGSGAAPQLTRDRGGVWELPLATYRAHADGTLSIVRWEVIEFAGGIRSGNSGFRPPDAERGGLFYEPNTGRLLIRDDALEWQVIHEDTGWQTIPMQNHWVNETLRIRRVGRVVNLLGRIRRGFTFTYLATGDWETFSEVTPQFRPRAWAINVVNCVSMATRSMQMRVSPNGDVHTDLDGEDMPTNSPVDVNMTWLVD